MGLSVWRETSKKLTVYRVCYTPIETLLIAPVVSNIRTFNGRPLRMWIGVVTNDIRFKIFFPSSRSDSRSGSN